MFIVYVHFLKVYIFLLYLHQMVTAMKSNKMANPFLVFIYSKLILKQQLMHIAKQTVGPLSKQEDNSTTQRTTFTRPGKNIKLDLEYQVLH